MRWLAFAALVGCVPTPVTTDTPSSGPPSSWPAVPIAPVERAAYTESVSARPALSVATVAPADLVTVHGAEVTLLDPLGAEALLARDLGPVHGAAWWDGDLLLTTASGVVRTGERLDPALDTALAELTGATELLPLASGLWIAADAGLHVLRDGEVLAVTVAGTPTRHFASSTLDQRPVIWTAVGSRAVAVELVDGVLESLEPFELFGPIDALAATADGRVLALVDGWIVERTTGGSWWRLDVGEPVLELHGGRGTDGIWVRTEGRWLYYADDVYATDVPLTDPGVEDDHGRLVTYGAGGVVRYSVDRPLVLDDVPTSGVVGATEVRVVPTQRDLEPQLAVVATPLVGSSVQLPVVDHGVTVDPAVLGAGPWSLDATATYADGTERASAVFVVGADFVPTWGDHVQPIFQRRCTPCHEGNQGILQLTQESQWIDHLLQGSRPGSDGILDRVGRGNMPPNGRPLTELELFVLRAWSAVVLP